MFSLRKKKTRKVAIWRKGPRICSFRILQGGRPAAWPATRANARRVAPSKAPNPENLLGAKRFFPLLSKKKVFFVARFPLNCKGALKKGRAPFFFEFSKKNCLSRSTEIYGKFCGENFAARPRPPSESFADRLKWTEIYGIGA